MVLSLSMTGIVDVFDFEPGLREHVRKDRRVAESVQAAGEEAVAFDHGSDIFFKDPHIERVGDRSGAPHGVDHLEDLAPVREEERVAGVVSDVLHLVVEDEDSPLRVEVHDVRDLVANDLFRFLRYEDSVGRVFDGGE